MHKIITQFFYFIGTKMKRLSAEFKEKCAEMDKMEVKWTRHVYLRDPSV
jgi:hypothetical protein